MFSHKLVTGFINGPFCLLDVNTGNMIKDFSLQNIIIKRISDRCDDFGVYFISSQYMASNLHYNFVPVSVTAFAT